MFNVVSLTLIVTDCGVMTVKLVVPVVCLCDVKVKDAVLLLGIVALVGSISQTVEALLAETSVVEVLQLSTTALEWYPRG